MATYDNALGMWKAKTGGYFASREEAESAESTGAANQSDFFGEGLANSVQAPEAAPVDPRVAAQAKLRAQATQTANVNAASDRSGASDSGYYGTDASQAAYERGNLGGASGAYDTTSAAGRSAYDTMHQQGGGGGRATWADVLDSPGVRAARSVLDPVYGATQVAKAVAPAGAVRAIDTAASFANAPVASTLSATGAPGAVSAAFDPLGYARNAAMGKPSEGSLGPTGFVDASARGAETYRDLTGQPAPGSGAGGAGSGGYNLPASPTGSSAASGGSSAPGVGGGAGRAGVDQETADARTRALDAIDKNRDENQQLFKDAFNRYDAITGGDYGLSDEARGYQREGLQQQRMLLQKMLGFDEDQAARRYGDQTLAREIAAGRSAGGGAAGQQAGVLAAMEQAPALYAQGRQQAANEATTRLAQAETASKAFGDLGTMTRGQDEQRAQFEANLSKGIADSVANLTEGNVQMNDRDSQQMAEIWMDFAKLQSVYAGMSSEEQLAWWQNETARRGQDQNFNTIMAQLKAQGKITAKDLIGGLFQLGGGVLSAGGSLGNAYIQGQTARAIAGANAPAAAPAAPVYGTSPTAGALGDYDPLKYANYA